MELAWGLTKLFTPILYLVSLGVIVATVFYRIEVGIFFLAFFLPLQNILDYVNIYPMGKDINDLIIIAMLIKWLIKRKDSDEKALVSTPFNLPIILLFIWTLFGVIRGTAYLELSSPTSLSNPLLISWKNYLIPYIFFFIVLNNIKKPQQIKFLILVMVLTILVLDRNFYNVISQHDMSHYSDELKMKLLTGGAAITGNALAVFLAQYAIILLLLFFYDTNKLRKTLFIFTTSLSYYCIMFLFSRSGYLAAITSVSFIGIVKKRWLLLIILPIFLFYQGLLPNAVVERIEMTQSKEEYDASAQQRLGMWEQAMEMIGESPILGWGFGITPLIEVKAGWQSGDRYWGSFHNNYLQTTVELGLIGLGLILLLYFQGIWTGWKLYRISSEPLAKGLGLGFIACIIATLAGNINGSYWHFFTIGSFYWTFQALVYRFIILEEQANETSEEEILSTSPTENNWTETIYHPSLPLEAK